MSEEKVEEKGESGRQQHGREEGTYSDRGGDGTDCRQGGGSDCACHKGKRPPQARHRTLLGEVSGLRPEGLGTCSVGLHGEGAALREADGAEP